MTIFEHFTLQQGAKISRRLSIAMDFLRVKKLTENAVIPVRGSKFAAGFDLSSAVDCSVPARGKALVKTDLAISIPENTYARVAPRSGLAWKNSIDVGAGVIDYDYRGNVGVILFNFSDVDFEVKKGDRVAQLIIEKISMIDAVEVQELEETDRGAGGFGSTGVSSAVVAEAVEQCKKARVEDDDSKLSEVLLFLDSVSGEIGDDRRKRAKALVLSAAKDTRVHAAMVEYRATQSVPYLLETLDLIL